MDLIVYQLWSLISLGISYLETVSANNKGVYFPDNSLNDSITELPNFKDIYEEVRVEKTFVTTTFAINLVTNQTTNTTVTNQTTNTTVDATISEGFPLKLVIIILGAIHIGGVAVLIFLGCVIWTCKTQPRGSQYEPNNRENDPDSWSPRALWKRIDRISFRRKRDPAEMYNFEGIDNRV